MSQFEDLVRSRSQPEMAKITEAAISRPHYRIELWLACGFVFASVIAVIWLVVSMLNRAGWAGPFGLVSFAVGLAALWLGLKLIVRLSFVVGQRAVIREAIRGQHAAGA